jgi:hypothetical protein
MSRPRLGSMPRTVSAKKRECRASSAVASDAGHSQRFPERGLLVVHGKPIHRPF